MLADILLRGVEQQRDLLLRQPNILTLEANIDIGNTVVVLIQEELPVFRRLIIVIAHG